eukprot:705482-Amphidinium_carterae.1
MAWLARLLSNLHLPCPCHKCQLRQLLATTSRWHLEKPACFRLGPIPNCFVWVGVGSSALGSRGLGVPAKCTVDRLPSFKP